MTAELEGRGGLRLRQRDERELLPSLECELIDRKSLQTKTEAQLLALFTARAGGRARSTVSYRPTIKASTWADHQRGRRHAAGWTTNSATVNLETDEN